MPVDPRAPCVIGVGQRTWRWSGEPAPEPLAMWEEAARAAGDDAGTERALTELDSIQIVYCQSWQYDDPPSRLAERLGASAKHRFYSGIGGTTPQVLVSDAAIRILDGEADLALVAGAEALETIRRLGKAGEKPRWSHKHPSPPPFPFPDPFHPAEVAHEVFQAWLTFPVFDVARRANVPPDEYRRRLGELLAPMTEIAARNPHAWFPNERSVDELITATPQNRMVGYPYTKYMVSIMDVDMSAAVIVASHEKADSLGIPAERRVYLRGWCYAKDPVYLAERENLAASNAMRAAGEEALRSAGAGIDNVAHFDLYSCFTSSINLTRDALGISADDERPVTVTGGLPFAGGAGSNYMSHSIAAMTEKLREDPGALGMVSGVGMHMVKHNFALYSTEPGPVRRPDEAAVQERLDKLPRKTIRNEYSGPATVATYTVAHARGGDPDWGLAICDVAEGERCYARVHDADLLSHIERDDWVGSKVELVTEDGKRNLVKA